MDVVQIQTSTSGPDEEHHKPNIWKLRMSILRTSVRRKQLDAAQVRLLNKQIESRPLHVRLTPRANRMQRRSDNGREKTRAHVNKLHARETVGLRVLDTCPTRVSFALGKFQKTSKANLISHSGLLQPAPHSVGQTQTPHFCLEADP